MAEERTLNMDQWYKDGGGAPDDAFLVIETNKGRYAFIAREVYDLRQGKTEEIQVAYEVIEQLSEESIKIREIKDPKRIGKLSRILLAG